jgi:ribose/xylose/arabinose/galactoside ABC-type transport system permease subunit
MSEGTSFAKFIITIGIVIVIFGVIVLLVSQATKGRGAPLPGDIVIHRRNVTVYFPIISSIVISVVLTVVLWIISALRR